MSRKRRTTGERPARRPLNRKTLTIDPAITALGPDFVVAAEAIAAHGGTLRVDPATGDLEVSAPSAASAPIFQILARLTKTPE